MSDEQYEELQEVEQRPFDYGLLKRMLRYTIPYRKQLALATVVIAIGSILRLTEPYLLRTAIDLGITPGNMRVVNTVAILWLVFQLLGAGAEYVRIHILNRTGQNLLYDMRQELFTHLQWLSLRFYDGRPVGRIMARVTNDVETINDLINSGLVTIISQAVSLVGIVIILFVVNVRLALLAMLVVPGMAWVVVRLRPRMETGWRNVRKANSNINANLNETITGIRVSQAFCRENTNILSFEKLNNNYYDAFMGAIRAEVLIWPTVDVLGTVGSALVLWAGARMVLNDVITVGYVLAFTDYLFRFWEPISAISRVYSRVLSAMASAERIFEYLDTQPEILDAEGAQPLPPIKGQVTMENISFRYKEDDRWVLKDINFTIQPGQTVALVGPTGAGKTSIINLLMRFYDPQQGRVLIDGHDLAQVQLPSVRSQIALVLQESFLFSGTIADNIRYSRLDASQEDIERAAQAVQADRFIMKYADGYAHEVGERGSNISVGQRQLISFARALLADPRILILDEATSSVDSQTERAIQEAMHTLLEGRTTFIIAHRLSTIQRADTIFVIEDGRIVEQGRHEELLAMPEGRYAHLYQRQFASWEIQRQVGAAEAEGCRDIIVE
ncbi:MAG: ABC transporter ATP-binding protein/permease [Chloroflexi bacterium]|nr:ABC transporter ATP-binding protein/permease [Chloroflexota bacterium]